MAKGKLIAFIDSDCQATESWLTKLTESINELNAGGVGGPGVSPPEEGFLSTAIDCVYDSYIGSLGSASLTTPSKVIETKALSTHNCIYQKKVLIRVGGFDERYTMNEDTDLSNRVRQEGFKLYVTPNAVVYHKRKQSLKEFATKFFRYGVSRTRAMLTDQKNVDTRILAFMVLLFFGLYTLMESKSIAGIMLSAYTIEIVGSGFYYAFNRQIIKLALYIPILYILQHFSYASGLLWGITKGKYRKLNPASGIKATRCSHN
jgi:GT2 family glycosyltransferase